MDFASLFHLQIDNLPTRMGYWLDQNYNPRNSTLYLADGTGVSITEQDVELVLGFPRGDIKIEKWSRAHSTDLLEWKGLVDKSARGYLYSDVIKAMLSCEDGGLWFKRHFILLVCSLFIDTPQNGYVRPHIFHHLVDVDQIKNLNWCDYVLRSLMDSQLAWAKSSKALFTGSLLFFDFDQRQRSGKKFKPEALALVESRIDSYMLQKILKNKLSSACNDQPSAQPQPHVESQSLFYEDDEAQMHF
nr:hypothetical protein DM860_011184 [Ipomoea batatas]